MTNSVQYDEFGIPINVSSLQHALFVKDDERLEKVLGRKLTHTEQSAAESMASEHASYGSTKIYLKTILPVDGPNHFAGIGHEAAAVAMFVRNGKSIALVYSSESHNGPSFVCPDPGAATGVGGDVRDRGAELSVKPVLQLEARRQCHPRHNPKKDPIKRHTDETTHGIASYSNAMGIPHGDGSIKYHAGYQGNNLVNVMGISVGEKEKLNSNKVPKGNPEDYVAIYIGKASDTTGIGGTKFASKPIDMTDTDLNEKAVQDPDPHLQEAIFRGIETLMEKAYKEGWTRQISWKDMGAAGLLCSTLEQLHTYDVPAELDAAVDEKGNVFVSRDIPYGITLAASPTGVPEEEYQKLLDDGKIRQTKVPAKRKVKVGVVINGDLIPQNSPRTSLELLEAETQERFMVYVHKDHAQDVLDVFNDEIGLPYINKGAQAAIIGRCNSSGNYTFVRDGVVDVNMPHEDLMSGPLLFQKVAERKPSGQKDINFRARGIKRDAARVLDSINFKSDSYVHDHYDKHVQSNNIVTRGEGCAILFTHPLFEGEVGYSAVFDSNPVLGMLSPRMQAEDSFLRAAYKMATVGCSVVGVTNNANYGRTNVPEEMWEFVEGQYGVAKACKNWELDHDYLDMIRQDPEIASKLAADERRHVTVNSGNASLNKANANTGTAIPPTTILGVVGWTNQPAKYATWDMKPAEANLFVIGERDGVLAGSDLLQTYGPDNLGSRLRDIDYEKSQREVRAIISAVRGGYVMAANAIEEGGLLNAIAEMSANSADHVDIHVNVSARMGREKLDVHQKLFSENYGVVLQVKNDKVQEFQELCELYNVTPYAVGHTKASSKGYGCLDVHGKRKLLAYSQYALKKNYFEKLSNELEASQ